MRFVAADEFGVFAPRFAQVAVRVAHVGHVGRAAHAARSVGGRARVQRHFGSSSEAIPSGFSRYLLARVTCDVSVSMRATRQVGTMST